MAEPLKIYQSLLRNCYLKLTSTKLNFNSYFGIFTSTVAPQKRPRAAECQSLQSSIKISYLLSIFFFILDSVVYITWHGIQPVWIYQNSCFKSLSKISSKLFPCIFNSFPLQNKGREFITFQQLSVYDNQSSAWLIENQVS